MKNLRFFVLLFLLFTFSFIQAQDTINECPPEGSTESAKYQALNKLKNRFKLPTVADFDKTITLDKILTPGNDEERFDESKAVVIEGYIFNIKIGGIESCNCRAKSQEFRDVHVEIVPTAKTKTYKKRVIAEITPRLRKKIFTKLGVTNNKELKKLLKGKKVRITGWLMFDIEHNLESYNIDPKNKKGRKNWRATCWEIHPITDIEVVEE
ncbi:MAG TPA: hypothetical protein VIL99_16160 [Ignavibacteria bacterium]